VSEALTLESGNIDILVNNAAAELNKPLEAIDADDFANVFDLNVRAPTLLTQAILPHLRHPGRIINISSVGARAGFANLSMYCSSKAALEGLTRCWAAELGKNGTTVNAVASGPVESDMLANIPKEIVDMQKKSTPVGQRVGTASEIASVVSWLASPESGWISGQVLNASGGWTMY
jgi:3-oxoacyl-[acyl-carrier protein] reductase